MRQCFPGLLFRSLVGASGAVVFALCLPAPVQAQGFLESLFGGFSAPQHQPPPRVYQPRPPAVFYAPPRQRIYIPQPYGERQDRQSRRVEAGRNGHFKTMCVRLCDGYYFPISHGVSRSRFNADAEACQSRCSADARLFFLPANATDISAARDRMGRTYENLKSAFLYRKSAPSQCTCRPDPWSEAERARHASYRIEEEQRQAEAQRRAAEDREEATGVPAGVAERLFSGGLAEALPPAPERDWEIPSEPTERALGGMRIAAYEGAPEREPEAPRRVVREPPQPARFKARSPRVYRLPRQRQRHTRRGHGGSWISGLGGGGGGLRWPGD